MSEVIRTEEWTIEEEGMISTLVVLVWEDERVAEYVVQVRDALLPELGLAAEDYSEIVEPWQERFVRSVPYEAVRVALITKGFKYARTT